MGVRRIFSFLLLIAVVVYGTAQLAGCGDEQGNGFDASGDGMNNMPGDDGGPSLGGDGGIVTSITIMPADPTVMVNIDDGVLTTMPLAFQAIGNNGAQVTAAFSLDRGELGDMTATGT